MKGYRVRSSSSSHLRQFRNSNPKKMSLTEQKNITKNLLEEINLFLPATVQKIGNIANKFLIFRLSRYQQAHYIYFAPCAELRVIAFQTNSPHRDYDSVAWLGPILPKLLETNLIKIRKEENSFSLVFDNDLTCKINYFGPMGNAVVINNENKIAAAWYPGKLFHAGEEYKLPQAATHKDTNIRILDAVELIPMLNNADLDVAVNNR